MTIEEALKVIDLNIDKLNGSMQAAVALLVDEAEKIQVIKEVLDQRRVSLGKAIETSKKDKLRLTREWLKGKDCGYSDALELLKSKLESIRVELL